MINPQTQERMGTRVRQRAIENDQSRDTGKSGNKSQTKTNDIDVFCFIFLLILSCNNLVSGFVLLVTLYIPFL
jgi:hypothetical protein